MVTGGIGESMGKVFSVLDVGLSDRHECEAGIQREIYYNSARHGWQMHALGSENKPIFYCPWCGEKLPERVIVPPSLTAKEGQARLEEMLRQTEEIGRTLSKWVDEGKAWGL